MIRDLFTRVSFSKVSEKQIFIILSSFLFLYLVLRALFVPVIMDEISTLHFYVQSGEFLPFLSRFDTNNHILNSALTYVSYLLLGSSKIALRLPNVLSAILFLIYTYKISRHIPDKFLRWVFILSICTVHSILEYFTFCRGYGMSIALMIAGIYHLMMAQQTNKYNHYTYCFVFTTLALSANLTLMVTSLIILGLAIIKFIHARHFTRADLCKFIGIVLFLSIIPLAFLTVYLFELRKKNLIFGSDKSFWDSTVRSLTVILTDHNYLFVKVLFIVYFIIICSVWIYFLIKKKSLNILTDSNFTFFYLFIGNLIAIFVLKGLFGIYYPRERTAIYFFPLFFGSIIFMLNMFQNVINTRVIKILSLALLLIPVHFAFNMNLEYSYHRKYATMPERFYHLIKSTWNQENPPPTVAGSGLQAKTWNYIKFRNCDSLNHMQTFDYPGNLTDYQIGFVNVNPEWLQYYDIIETDEAINISLLKRKEPLHRSLITAKDSIQTPGYISRKGFVCFNETVDTLVGQNIYIDIDLSVLGEPFIANIGIELRDEQEQLILYEPIDQRKKHACWNKLINNFHGCLLTHIPENAHRLKIYVWNKNSKSYMIDGGIISLSKAVPYY